MLRDVALALLVAFAATRARVTTISNTAPRRDVTGAVIDVHDGVIRQWAPRGLYHWYGMGYGPCNLSRADGCAGMYGPPHCGFQLNHSVNLFTSPGPRGVDVCARRLPRRRAAAGRRPPRVGCELDA